MAWQGRNLSEILQHQDFATEWNKHVERLAYNVLNVFQKSDFFFYALIEPQGHDKVDSFPKFCKTRTLLQNGTSTLDAMLTMYSTYSRSKTSSLERWSSSNCLTRSEPIRNSARPGLCYRMKQAHWTHSLQSTERIHEAFCLRLSADRVRMEWQGRNLSKILEHREFATEWL
jgi:hypothetical protein